MLATLTEDRFDDPNWIYERKLDGERVIVFKAEDRVRLRSRSDACLNDTYPEIEKAVARQRVRHAILDGEVVAFSRGKTSFERLQGRMQLKDREQAKQSRIAVYYYVFDLLYLEGRDITNLALIERKRLLRSALDWAPPVRYTPYRRQAGVDFYKEACSKGWEGLIAKDGQSSYVFGRSTQWLKFKCVHRQEFVIAGFTEPKGSRIGFGAILAGVYEGSTLHYAGRVGTGFGTKMLHHLRSRFNELEIDECPFAEEDEASGPGVHWMKPVLVGEVKFAEWTSGGKLRHPRFLGLRDDKDASSVHREHPE